MYQIELLLDALLEKLDVLHGEPVPLVHPTVDLAVEDGKHSLLRFEHIVLDPVLQAEPFEFGRHHLGNMVNQVPLSTFGSQPR